MTVYHVTNCCEVKLNSIMLVVDFVANLTSRLAFRVAFIGPPHRQHPTLTEYQLEPIKAT